MLTIQPFGKTGSPSITVPNNKILMVETLSVQVDVSPSGSKLETFLQYRCGGVAVTLHIPVTYAYTATSGFDFYVTMQAVRLYADPGTQMEVSIYSPTGSHGTLFLTVSGQLI